MASPTIKETNMKALTQDRLKELFHYDQETGDFIRIKHRRSTLVGKKAGYVGKRGYAYISIDDKEYRGHLLAFLYMTGEFPEILVDHEDRIRHNNSWSNLRLVTPSQNNMNSSRPSNNTSGVSGVSWCKDRGKWASEIRNKSMGRKRLGRFEDFFEAVCARKSAEVEFGFSVGHGQPQPSNYPR